MDRKKFILINLNQNISKARRAAYKDNRDRWIIFGLLCFGFFALTGWFVNINNEYNKLIKAREETIEDIKEKTKKLQDELVTLLEVDINLSKPNLISAYKLGESYIPWSNKLEQFSELAPDDMCITKLNYSHGKLIIFCDSKVHTGSKPNEESIPVKFVAALQNNEDFEREFSAITLTSEKRMNKYGQRYDSFIITATLKGKNKIKNRLDDIPIPPKKTIVQPKKKIVETPEEIAKIPEKVIEIPAEIVEIPEKVIEIPKEVIETPKEVKKINKNKSQKYDMATVEAAKNINIAIPGEDPIAIKKFQELTHIADENDSHYGHYNTETQRIHLDVLAYQIPETPKKNESSKKDTKKGEKKIKKEKYDIATVEAAKNINMAALGENPMAIKKFQELVGIANENDSDYGLYTEETAKVHRDVLGSQIK